MARPKKSAVPVAPDASVEPEVPAGPPKTLITVDVQEFIKVRDSIITGLANIQNAIQTLCTGYLNHSNIFLNDHGAGLDVQTQLASLRDNPLLQSVGAPLAVAAAPSAKAGKLDKNGEVKKKRVHDANAPKRPLTPFFLYMQTARPLIHLDMAAVGDTSKGAVSTEGTRRWTEMTAEEKHAWTGAYHDNLRLYNARMHAYKNGRLDAKDMDEYEADAYATAHGIEHKSKIDASAALPTTETETEVDPDLEIQAQLEDEDAEGEAEADAEERQITPSPTPKPKTPKAKRKTKASKNTPVVSTPGEGEGDEEVEPKSVEKGSAVKAEKEKSPEKKRKRSKKDQKADEEEAAAAEVEDVEEKMAVETPKTAGKPRKRSKKSDA